jgi:serine/threonine protein kinase
MQEEKKTENKNQCNINKNKNKKGIIIGNYLVTEKRIGRGATSTVYVGYHLKKKIKVAVKKFEVYPNGERAKRKAFREMELLRRMDHPNIIKLYDIYYNEKKGDLYLFLEFCHKGSIKSFLGEGGYVEEKHAKRLTKQLLSGLRYIHNMGVYHRDIKPHNLLLSKNYNLKISDFGLATMNTRGTFKRLCGSPLYMAPEVLTSSFYNEKSDIWSVGIFLFEILFGFHPFSSKVRTLPDIIKIAKKGISIEIPPPNLNTNTITNTNTNTNRSIECSENCIDFLRKTLVVKIDERIDWKDLFVHPWVTTDISKKVYQYQHVIDILLNENDWNSKEDKNKIFSPKNEPCSPLLCCYEKTKNKDTESGDHPEKNRIDEVKEKIKERKHEEDKFEESEEEEDKIGVLVIGETNDQTYSTSSSSSLEDNENTKEKQMNERKKNKGNYLLEKIKNTAKNSEDEKRKRCYSEPPRRKKKEAQYDKNYRELNKLKKEKKSKEKKTKRFLFARSTDRKKS